MTEEATTPDTTPADTTELVSSSSTASGPIAAMHEAPGMPPIPSHLPSGEPISTTLPQWSYYAL